MLGEKQRTEPMFYHVRMADIIPENHLLRLVDRYVDLTFIRGKVKHLYSHTGRPSIDPEILLRMLLIGYLYGITSERRLCEEVKMHIGYRWFVGLNLEDKVPDHSTFSKNRHDRFSENDIFQEIFDEIVNQCITKGLLTGKHLTVDSTYIKANASFKSLEPIVVDITTKEYIKKVTEENPVNDEPWEPGLDYPHRGQRISNKTHRSKTDPDARISRKSSNKATDLHHAATYIMDNKSRIIVGADIGMPDKKTDCDKALTQIQRMKWTYKIKPESLGADKGYSAGEFIDVTKGLLTGKHLTVDSTYIKANASFKSLEPIVVDITTKEYIKKVTEENPVNDEPWEPGLDYPHRGQRISNKTHRSKTDPDARISRKSSNKATDLHHAATYIMDNKSRIIVGADIGMPDKKTDCDKALTQIQRMKWTYKIKPESLGADKGYSAGEFIDADKGIIDRKTPNR